MINYVIYFKSLPGCVTHVTNSVFFIVYDILFTSSMVQSHPLHFIYIKKRVLRLDNAKYYHVLKIRGAKLYDKRFVNAKVHVQFYAI